MRRPAPAWDSADEAAEVDDGDPGGLGLGGGPEIDGLPAEEHVAAVAPMHARRDLDERGLAGAVLPDQGVDGAGQCPQGSGPQGHDRSERLGHRPQFERGSWAVAGHRHVLTSLKGD